MAKRKPALDEAASLWALARLPSRDAPRASGRLLLERRSSHLPISRLERVGCEPAAVIGPRTAWLHVPVLRVRPWRRDLAACQRCPGGPTRDRAQLRELRGVLPLARIVVEWATLDSACSRAVAPAGDRRRLRRREPHTGADRLRVRGHPEISAPLPDMTYRGQAPFSPETDDGRRLNARGAFQPTLR